MIRTELKGISIKSKLLLFSLCISLIPIIILTAIYYRNTRNTLKKHTLNNLAAMAALKKNHVLSFMEAKKERTLDFSSDGLIKRSLEIIKRTGSISEGGALALSKHLSLNKKSLDPAIISILVVDSNYKAVAATDEHLIGADISVHKQFSAGLKNNNRMTASAVQPFFYTYYNVNCLSIIAPITASKIRNETLGFIINCYDLSALNKITFMRTGMGKTGEVYLVNRDRKMITESLFVEGAPMKQVVDTKPVQKIIEDNKEITAIYNDYRGVPVVGASAYIPEYDWIVLAEVDKDEAFEALMILNITALSVSIVCAVVVVSLGIIFAFSTSKPINILKNATESFSSGNLEHRVEITSRDEIGVLAQSFNAMADALMLETHKLTCAVEQSPCAIIITNTQGDIEYVNPKFTQLTSYTAQEVFGKTPRILKSGNTSPEEYQKLWNTIASGREWHGEFCNTKKNGDIYWASATISPVRNAAGIITNYVAIQEDITERNHSEKTLKDAVEQRDKNIIDLKYLMHFSTIMNDEVQEEALLEHMSIALKERFKPDVLAVLMLDKEKNVVNIPTVMPKMPVLDLIKGELLTDHSLCRVIRTGHPFISRDVSKEPSCECTRYKIREGGHACLPVIADGSTAGVVLLIKKEKDYWKDNENIDLLSTYIGLASSALHRVRLMRITKHASITDPLTGTYNRRFFDEMIVKHLALAQRHNEPLSILIVDLDHFKKINDTYGHSAGDVILQQTSGIMLSSIRSSDMLARYGGEEFVIIMPATVTKNALEKAEEIRQQVESEHFNIITKESPPKITISIGIASYPEHGTESDILIHAADNALYKAKRNGRNRVETV